MKTKLLLLSIMLLGSEVGQVDCPQGCHIGDINKAFKVYCATLRAAIEYEYKHPEAPDAIALRDEAYSPQGDACTGQPGFEPLSAVGQSGTHQDWLNAKTYSLLILFGERVVYRLDPIDTRTIDRWRVHDRLEVTTDTIACPHGHVMIRDVEPRTMKMLGAVCAVELLEGTNPRVGNAAAIK